MSRGFVKEDDQEEAPFIPPRAPLPQGAINYVTPRGLQQLQQEKQRLESDRHGVIEKAAGRSNDSDRRRELAVINGQLDQLNERIASAQVVPPLPDPTEVRFGTTVTFEHLTGAQKGRQFTFTIVGVDEADVKEGRIAFTAPIARALIGSTTGSIAMFKLGERELRLKVLRIR